MSGQKVNVFLCHNSEDKLAVIGDGEAASAARPGSLGTGQWEVFLEARSPINPLPLLEKPEPDPRSLPND